MHVPVQARTLVEVRIRFRKEASRQTRGEERADERVEKAGKENLVDVVRESVQRVAACEGLDELDEGLRGADGEWV